MTIAPWLFCNATLVQGAFGTWHMLSSTSMIDSVTGLRYAERSRAPDYITNGHGYPMLTISCTWRQVVPIGEGPPRFKNDDKMMMKVIFG